MPATHALSGFPIDAHGRVETPNLTPFHRHGPAPYTMDAAAHNRAVLVAQTWAATRGARLHCVAAEVSAAACGQAFAALGPLA